MDRIDRSMTDNAGAYKYSLRELCAELGIKQSSNPIAPGRTGKSNDSTGLCNPSGHIGRRSPATTRGPQPLHRGSITTQPDVATAHSEAWRRSVDCNQPDGRYV